jgi:hypothetical protein
MNDPSYRDAAMKMQAELHCLDGLKRAVDVIERSLEKHTATQHYGPLASLDRQANDIRNTSFTRR